MKKQALLAACAAAGTAFAQQWMPPPDPIDLQAAYCFGLAKITMPTNGGADTEALLPPGERAKYRAHVAQQAANFNRLQGYMAGRLGIVDGTGLMIASKQAEADLNFSIASITSCVRACAAPPCNCGNPTQIQSKIDRCKSLDFLPY